MITNIYTAVQEIMRKLKDSLTLRKFEVQSVAAQAKRLAAAGGEYWRARLFLPKERDVFYRDWQQHAEADKRIIFRCNNSLLQIKKFLRVQELDMVENTGFEPVASCLPGKRSSQMS